MNKYLVVAQHKENVNWAHNMDKSWLPIIYTAGTPESPNSPCGCEAFAYLQEICRQWDMFKPDDVVAFCQADPFPHCGAMFIPNLDRFQYQGKLHHCNSGGGPHCTYLDLDGYCRTFDIPHSTDYPFSEGAHFKTTGARIRSRPLSFYEALRNLVNTPHSRDPKYHAMTMERLWFNVFDIKP